MLAGEVQACADAASERVQALESQLDSQASDTEAAAAAAKAELECTQADAAATLITVKAELKAALAAAETELAATQVWLHANVMLWSSKHSKSTHGVLKLDAHDIPHSPT